MQQVFHLWIDVPGTQSEVPTLTWYPPMQKAGNSAVIIFPGGGYHHRAAHEGEGYARMLNSFGITAFVVDYRVLPAKFPDPLSDARRAVRYVRYHAEQFGIDKDKIAVMGSSAGGHLTALLCTYETCVLGDGIDEISKEDYLPNAQILCYPVISHEKDITNMWSYNNLLGEDAGAWQEYSPDKLVNTHTPQAFIWHTAEDAGVNVINSYYYATALRQANVPCEMHVFPYGAHGLGLAPRYPHIAQWSELLRHWLQLIGF